jgi:ADP-ribose pyrophosphatase YjhB (NUDIX family)
MSEPLQFLYKREFWYISAFLNVTNIDIAQKTKEIETLFLNKFNNLGPQDLKRVSFNPKFVEKLIDMGKNITLHCQWHTFLEGFPYYEENTTLVYNKLGFFEIEVEYFKENPEKKSELEPILMQQLPSIASDLLKKYCRLKVNNYLYPDTESPIYNFVTFNKTLPSEIMWNPEKIQEHKKTIGAWAEVYSGAWPDYTDSLYEKRVEHNLSNRLSEIHLIRRNSGFIYMAEDNYSRFFDSYMKNGVLRPTAQIRAMLFALISINESLDIVFLRQSKDDFMDISAIEEKLKNLRHLRGALQIEMSKIFNELDYNRRQHYASVLAHLLREFDLGTSGILARVNEKFDVIYDSMQRLYQKRESENQERTERGLSVLNTLFSLGVLADFTALLLGAVESYEQNNRFAFTINSLFSFFIVLVFFASIYARLRLRLESTKTKAIQAVDAVVRNEAGEILVILRRIPPFKGQFSFPGGLLTSGEQAEKTIVARVKQDTGVDVVVERKINVYDTPNRDPRGPVVSHAFLCRVATPTVELKKNEEGTIAQFVPASELSGLDMAFDHEDILSDALRG